MFRQWAKSTQGAKLDWRGTLATKVVDNPLVRQGPELKTNWFGDKLSQSAPEKEKKLGVVAIVHLANVPFWVVAKVLNKWWQLSQNGVWQMNAWQMSYLR